MGASKQTPVNTCWLHLRKDKRLVVWEGNFYGKQGLPAGQEHVGWVGLKDRRIWTSCERKGQEEEFQVREALQQGPGEGEPQANAEGKGTELGQPFLPKGQGWAWLGRSRFPQTSAALFELFYF